MARDRGTQGALQRVVPPGQEPLPLCPGCLGTPVRAHVCLALDLLGVSDDDVHLAASSICPGTQARASTARGAGPVAVWCHFEPLADAFVLGEVHDHCGPQMVKKMNAEPTNANAHRSAATARPCACARLRCRRNLSESALRSERRGRLAAFGRSWFAPFGLRLVGPAEDVLCPLDCVWVALAAGLVVFQQCPCRLAHELDLVGVMLRPSDTVQWATGGRRRSAWRLHRTRALTGPRMRRCAASRRSRGRQAG